MRLRRIARALLLLTLSGLLLLALGYGALGIAAYDVSGTAPAGKRLARMQRSPEWRDGRFGNAMPRVDGSYTEMARGWFSGGSSYRIPSAKIPIVERRGAEFPDSPPPGLRVTWLGHSTLLIEIDGQRVLIDPVWGERASPLHLRGARALVSRRRCRSRSCRRIDAVLISHDHYDHLDTATVRALAGRDVRWIVPLGVGAHLAGWGVPEAHITELDWWETRARPRSDGDRHARAPLLGPVDRLSDQYRTLWAGYALTRRRAPRLLQRRHGAVRRLPRDRTHGSGPFDLTLIEVGAYDRAVARRAPRARAGGARAPAGARQACCLPVHWGLFDLAMHGWTEPMERVLAAAAEEGVDVFTPRPGETIEVGARAGLEARATAVDARWWPKLPWQTVAEHDVRSSGVAHLLDPRLVQ